jgi:molybdate transport system substrate-binding protein
VKIPNKVNVIATYPIGVVKASQNATAAKAWVKFVRSKEGQAILRKFGFLPP